MVSANADIKKAVNVLHEEHSLNLLINSSIFLLQVLEMWVVNYFVSYSSNKNFLEDHLNLQVRVVGIANSRKTCTFADKWK